ncbi:hypothetical protein MPSEU_000566100 [Mayamaea pseudoterrestris]|nr:hypothetical protein MPSEU_000566100 [Mayamaea pseudoterrestris]
MSLPENKSKLIFTESLECGTSLAELEYFSSPPRVDEANAEQVLRDDSKTTASPSTIHKAWDEIASIESLRDLIASDVWSGNDGSAPYTTFDSPFPLDLTPGAPRRESRKLPLVYCDQTATNRPLKSIEQYISRVCLPLYGNTHTNTSITGSQSTAFVAEARQIVAESTNAKITGKASLDVVLFAGQGATSAVELLIDCLGLKYSNQASLERQRAVVFVCPYAHHSALIPFRESGCEIVMVPECIRTKQVNVSKLDEWLQKADYQNRLKMGVFSAASNVTGKVSNVNEISATLHKHGALAFFDYATAASYTDIDMNPQASTDYSLASLTAKDAVFFSPHKMLGGVGAPGVLIIKKHLVSQSNPPGRSGGGTVFYVTSTHHRFLSNRIERYEGGSPNVPGIIRVGLAFLLKRKTDQMYSIARDREKTMMQTHATDSEEEIIRQVPESIEQQDYQIHNQVIRYLKENAPNLVLLDALDGNEKKLPIFSFLIRFGDRFLHYNYVCAVLNDVFGIQSRGGCQCAGPYSQRLLGLTENADDGMEAPNENNLAIEEALMMHKERAELLRPGFTRLSLPFKGLRAEEVNYVMRALAWTSKHAWALICQYRCSHRTGEFRHASRQGRPLGQERKWLGHFDLIPTPPGTKSTNVRGEYKDFLSESLNNADAILAAAVADQSSISQAQKMAGSDTIFGSGEDDKLEKLRWYVYAKDCASYLAKGMIEAPKSFETVGALAPVVIVESTGTTSEAPNVSHEVAWSQTDHSSMCEDYLLQLHKEPKKANRDESKWGKGANAQHTPDETDHRSLPLIIDKRAPSSRHPHVKPPAKLMRLITNAVMQWDMIQSGDRLLLGLSGGKDSLTLLHCLMELKRKLPTKFEIEVCTIDPQTPSFDPSPMIPYVESLGLTYHYIKDKIVDRASSSGPGGGMVKSLCAFCSRMKRGNLYAVARRANCNKLVLAQHLDDCAESFMMSVMHNGFLRTMKANYKINSGDLAVIRPLVYCRESLMSDFCKNVKLPVINENCPACFEEPKERARVKKLLSREETLYPNFYDNIRRSLLPLMHEESTAILRCYTEETLARSRKVQKRDRSPDLDESRTKKFRVDEMESKLRDASDEALILEIARRKAAKFHLAGAMKQKDVAEDFDEELSEATDKVCSIGGACGNITS